ncbi:MAG TPA: Os1348 family NHLP clan protein [Gemmatimonadales bacterium]|jgi:hypothetical protein|nr:Os1348 family NHLP clan protein [Gemmatimonadales bacterium]
MAQTYIGFNQLVVKMLGDATFRAAVMKNPAAALRSIRVKATARQIAALKAVDWASLERVFQSFQKGVHPNTFT